jgi:hypothetical protein
LNAWKEFSPYGAEFIIQGLSYSLTAIFDLAMEGDLGAVKLLLGLDEVEQTGRLSDFEGRAYTRADLEAAYLRLGNKLLREREAGLSDLRAKMKTVFRAIYESDYRRAGAERWLPAENRITRFLSRGSTMLLSTALPLLAYWVGGAALAVASLAVLIWLPSYLERRRAARRALLEQEAVRPAHQPLLLTFASTASAKDRKRVRAALADSRLLERAVRSALPAGDAPILRIGPRIRFTPTGAGAFKRAYLAEVSVVLANGEQRQVDIAIKIPRPLIGWVALLQPRIRQLWLQGHPNMPSYQFVEQGVMAEEFVHGKTLRELQGDGRDLDGSVSRLAVRSYLSVLKYLNDRPGLNWVLFDPKPENMILPDEPGAEPKLIDRDGLLPTPFRRHPFSQMLYYTAFYGSERMALTTYLRGLLAPLIALFPVLFAYRVKPDSAIFDGVMDAMGPTEGRLYLNEALASWSAGLTRNSPFTLALQDYLETGLPEYLRTAGLAEEVLETMPGRIPALPRRPDLAAPADQISGLLDSSSVLSLIRGISAVEARAEELSDAELARHAERLLMLLEPYRGRVAVAAYRTLAAIQPRLTPSLSKIVRKKLDKNDRLGMLSVSTFAGRLTRLHDYLLADPGIRALLLRPEGAVVNDIGLGGPAPVTTAELAARLRRVNPKIRVAGTDLMIPAFQVQAANGMFAYFDREGNLLGLYDDKGNARSLPRLRGTLRVRNHAGLVRRRHPSRYQALLQHALPVRGPGDGDHRANG